MLLLSSCEHYSIMFIGRRQIADNSTDTKTKIGCKSQIKPDSTIIPRVLVSVLRGLNLGAAHLSSINEFIKSCRLGNGILSNGMVPFLILHTLFRQSCCRKPLEILFNMGYRNKNKRWLSMYKMAMLLSGFARVLISLHTKV